MASFLQVLSLAVCMIASTGNPTIRPSPSVTNNLTINIDDDLRELYLDGQQIEYLPNALDWLYPDRVSLPDDTRVLAVLAENRGQAALLIASDSGGWILSDGLWRYSRVNSSNWMAVDFDDTAWSRSYVAVQCNDGYRWNRFPGISRHASGIWSPNFNNFTTNDNLLYFRLKIDRNRLRRDFDLISTDERIPKTFGCFSSRRIQCAASCSQITSLCSGFQHKESTNTCCLLSAAQLQFSTTTPSKGWNIWSSIVLNETCSC